MSGVNIDFQNVQKKKVHHLQTPIDTKVYR